MFNFDFIILYSYYKIDKKHNLDNSIDHVLTTFYFEKKNYFINIFVN